MRGLVVAWRARPAEFGAELVKAVILALQLAEMSVLAQTRTWLGERLRRIKTLSKGFELELRHLARIRSMAPLELKVVLDRFVQHSHARGKIQGGAYGKVGQVSGGETGAAADGRR